MAVTITIGTRTFTVERIECKSPLPYMRSYYVLHGPRGARYMLMRQAGDPTLLAPAATLSGLQAPRIGRFRERPDGTLERVLSGTEEVKR